MLGVFSSYFRVLTFCLDVLGVRVLVEIHKTDEGNYKPLAVRIILKA